MLFTLAAGTFAISAQEPVPTPPELDEVVKISTNLVQLDAVFSDKDGKPITDLTADDVEIFENGKKRDIKAFQYVAGGGPERSPNSTNSNPAPVQPTQIRPSQIRRTIAIIVDDLSLSFESAYRARQALRKFVSDQMTAGDLVAIIRTSGGIGSLQQFTTDKRILFAAIERIRWNPLGRGEVTAFSPIPPKDDDTEIETDEPAEKGTGETGIGGLKNDYFVSGTLGAIKFVVDGMTQLPGRKSIILVSDGFSLSTIDSDGFGDSSTNLDSFRALVDAANRASVVINTLHARGLQTTGITAADDLGSRTSQEISEIEAERRGNDFDSQDGLITLAAETGGIAILRQNDLLKGMGKILETQGYYLLAYEPDEESFDPAKLKFNRIEIKTKRDGVIARYRSGFLGLTDQQAAKRFSDISEGDRLAYALFSPFGENEIELSLNALFRANPKSGAESLSTFLHVPVKDLKLIEKADKNFVAVFELLVMNFGDNGVPSDVMKKTVNFEVPKRDIEKARKQGIVYYFSLPVKKPGPYQMRVAVRDKSTNLIGSASQFIEIPKLRKNRLMLSGLFIDNMSYSEWNASVRGTSLSKEGIVEAEYSTPYADTALRKFKRGTVLKYSFESYNAVQDKSRKPSLEVRTRLFLGDVVAYQGGVLKIDTENRQDPKSISATGAINLSEKLEPGFYTLQILVTDKNAKSEAMSFVQFELS